MKQLGNIERLPSGSYRLTYNRNGQRYRQTVKANTLTEAKRILNNLVNSVDTNTFQQKLNVDFCSFSQLWLDTYAKPHLSPTTSSNYIKMLNHYILPYIGKYKLTDITKMHIQKLIQTIKEDGRSVKTQKNYLTLVSSIYNYALENDYVKYNPCAGIKIRPDSTEEKKEMQVLNKKELKLFFEALDKETDKRFVNMVMLDLLTGLRLGELMGLMPKDVDFKKGTLTITRNRVIANGEIIIKDTKNHKTRTFSLPKKALEILKEECANKKQDELLFNMRPDSFPVHFRNFLKRHNLKKIRVYDLRHTNASLLHSEGVDYATIAGRIGNLPSTTANFYIHKINEKDEKAKQILDKLF